MGVWLFWELSFRRVRGVVVFKEVKFGGVFNMILLGIVIGKV